MTPQPLINQLNSLLTLACDWPEWKAWALDGTSRDYWIEEKVSFLEWQWVCDWYKKTFTCENWVFKDGANVADLTTYKYTECIVQEEIKQQWTCWWTIPENAIATTQTTFDQTWDSTINNWTPLTVDWWENNPINCDFNCDALFTWDGTMCKSNAQECIIEDGVWTELWDSTLNNYWECSVVSCNADFHTEDELTCVSDKKSCTVTNGTWEQTWTSSWWVCTVTTCEVDYYNSWDNTCSAVWNWYYSIFASTDRVACTNYPDNASRDYSYTSSWNWVDACTADYTDLCGVDEYESIDGVCSTVWNWEYSLWATNTKELCTTWPLNSSYTNKWNGWDNCSWTCNADHTEENGECKPDGQVCSITNGTWLQTWNSAINDWNACEVTWCAEDYYSTNNTSCIAVWNGYYSLNWSETRSECTTSTDTLSRDYIYTSSGWWTDACTADYTDLCWIDEYESSDWTCSAVWVWNYSANNNNEKVLCTNNEDNTSRDYSYITDWDGTNNCVTTYVELCWAWLYESSEWVCSTVAVTEYSPEWDNDKISCTNKPSNSYYIWNGWWTNSCSWSCSGWYTQSGNVCNLTITYSWDIWSYGSCSANPSWSSYGSCSASPYWSSYGGCNANCDWWTQYRTCNGTSGTQYRTCNGTSGTQTRTVTCKWTDGITYSDSYCTWTKPTTSTSCTESCSWSSSQSCTETCSWSNEQSCNTQLCVWSTKTASCNQSWKPSNSSYITWNVTVTWNGSSRSTASNCSWTCNTKYEKSWSICQLTDREFVIEWYRTELWRDAEQDPDWLAYWIWRVEAVWRTQAELEAEWSWWYKATQIYITVTWDFPPDTYDWAYFLDQEYNARWATYITASAQVFKLYDEMLFREWDLAWVKVRTEHYINHWRQWVIDNVKLTTEYISKH